MNSEFVKHDLNFSEYPLWFQDERAAARHQDGWLFEDRDGFLYRSGYRPPVKKDYIHLFAMLVQIQKQNWKETLRISRYELLRMCGHEKPSRKIYQRLEESLKRWMHIVVQFSGTFYDGKEYQVMQFHVLDHWEIEKETGDLLVGFSPSFLKQHRDSKFFQYINFNELKRLQTSLSTRLYEILTKSFHGREEWSIHAKKLAQKIPMSEKYVSHILPKIESAVRHINEKTSQEFRLLVKRPRRGEAILTFGKVAKESLPEQRTKTEEGRARTEQASIPCLTQTIEKVTQQIKAKAVQSSQQKEDYEHLLSKVREGERDKKTLQTLIQKSLKNNGKAYVLRNILYTNRHAKESYRAFLEGALKEDWGQKEDQEREQRKQALLEEQKQKQRQREADQAEQSLRRKAVAMLEQLPQEQRQKLELAARKKLGYRAEEKLQDIEQRILEMTMVGTLQNRISFDF